MLWIISFDITDNKARRRVTKVLEGYGDRIQYSIFECLVSRAQLRKIQTKLNQLISDDDKVLYYPICGKDILLRYADGSATVNWPAPLFIID